ncbi:MAG: hypothetical protein ACRDTQ_16895 [Micromonosporaceae bacterium]
MSDQSQSLDESVHDLLHAVESRDDERFVAALRGIANATPEASRDEVQAALGRLAPVLGQLSSMTSQWSCCTGRPDVASG